MALERSRYAVFHDVALCLRQPCSFRTNSYVAFTATAPIAIDAVAVIVIDEPPYQQFD